MLVTTSEKEDEPALTSCHTIGPLLQAIIFGTVWNTITLCVEDGAGNPEVNVGIISITTIYIQIAEKLPH